jgi:hypothetical protein
VLAAGAFLQHLVVGQPIDAPVQRDVAAGAVAPRQFELA